MTGPQDPAATGGDRLRAARADRERVIGALQDAFVHGRLTRDEFGERAGLAMAARTRADLAALTADIPAADIPAADIPAAGIPADPARPPARHGAGRWPGRPPDRAAAWPSRPPSCGSPAISIIRSAPVPISPGFPSALSWPVSPCSWRCSSLGTGWASHWSRDALAASCRPSRGRAGAPSEPDGATSARARFLPALAPTRPAPSCGLTSRRGGGTFPPGQAGHPVAPGRHRAQCDAGETAPGPVPARLPGLGVAS